MSNPVGRTETDKYSNYPGVTKHNIKHTALDREA